MDYWLGAALGGAASLLPLKNCDAKEPPKAEQTQEVHWAQSIALPFIIQWEGSVKDKDRKSYFI